MFNVLNSMDGLFDEHSNDALDFSSLPNDVLSLFGDLPAPQATDIAPQKSHKGKTMMLNHGINNKTNVPGISQTIDAQLAEQRRGHAITFAPDESSVGPIDLDDFLFKPASKRDTFQTNDRNSLVNSSDEAFEAGQGDEEDSFAAFAAQLEAEISDTHVEENKAQHQQAEEQLEQSPEPAMKRKRQEPPTASPLKIPPARVVEQQQQQQANDVSDEPKIDVVAVGEDYASVLRTMQERRDRIVSYLAFVRTVTTEQDIVARVQVIDHEHAILMSTDQLIELHSFYERFACSLRSTRSELQLQSPASAQTKKRIDVLHRRIYDFEQGQEALNSYKDVLSNV